MGNNMSSKKVKDKSNAPSREKSEEFYYIGENVEKYDFSDFVKIGSFPRGIVFSFGQWNAEKGQFGIFKEILLPFEVAESLSKIVESHIKELEKKGLLIKANLKAEIEK